MRIEGIIDMTCSVPSCPNQGEDGIDPYAAEVDGEKEETFLCKKHYQELMYEI